MSLISGVIVKWCSLMPAQKGYDNHHVIIIPQTGNGAGRPLERIEWIDDVMPGRDGPENLRILKR